MYILGSLSLFTQFFHSSQTYSSFSSPQAQSISIWFQVYTLYIIFSVLIFQSNTSIFVFAQSIIPTVYLIGDTAFKLIAIIMFLSLCFDLTEFLRHLIYPFYVSFFICRHLTPFSSKISKYLQLKASSIHFTIFASGIDIPLLLIVFYLFKTETAHFENQNFISM